MSESHMDLALRTRVVDGAVAGNITVTGIKPGDVLKAVQRIDEAGANLVGEFAITADNTINNAGGTSTATQLLLIIWIAKDDRGGPLDRS
jgi:predicted oxidoreductase